jgi:hypothetical protein
MGDTMNSVLVFAGRAAVDNESLRWQMLRVPEVTQVLREAQKVIDVSGVGSKDIVSFLQSENKVYLSGGLWRELSAQLVQIGLYRRYKKFYSQSRFLVGEAGVFSALQVCVQQVSMTDLIIAFAEQMMARVENEKSVEFLVGHALETSRVFEEKKDGSFEMIAEGKDTLGLMDYVAKDYLLDQVITFGGISGLETVLSTHDLSAMDSIAMDPLLGWLVPYLKAA